jgi:hypothetical protein
MRAGVTSIWLHHTGYAYTKLNGRTFSIHRLLMTLLGRDLIGLEVDHKNGHRLDNRINNLRIATKSQNRQNVGLSTTNTSGFKGVHFHKHNRRWVAYIGKRPRVYLGSFSSAEEAAAVYDVAAKKRFGKFSKLNLLNTKK